MSNRKRPAYLSALNYAADVFEASAKAILVGTVIAVGINAVRGKSSAQ